MEPVIRTLIDTSQSQAALLGQADIILERARWATTVFQRYDRDATMAIVDAVAKVAHDSAANFAKMAVAETGFGVVKDKTLKNELTAHPLVDYYRNQDFINVRIDEARKIVEIPKPAGVIFALTPSTNPISTLNYKILLSLMTRNSIVISPHPAALECSIKAAEELADAALAAGAPDGVIQILTKPSIPLVETFMSSVKTNVILATGGTAMVRAAYASSTPAIGVGPGNAPVLVDSSADIKKAVERIISSKSFDNSVLCTNESVLICVHDIEKPLLQAFKSAKAYVCNSDEVQKIRKFIFHDRGFNIECIGADASWIAKECGIAVPSHCKVLITPITKIGVEEPLSQEKLCPVLAMCVTKSISQAITQAKAVLRLAGAGHSAAIHTRDEATALAYASAVEVYRVVVNAPCSQGSSGFMTNLAPAFTVGTGYFGRSSVGENVGPKHLVHWTKMAYVNDPDESFGNYQQLSPGFDGPLAKAPSDGVPGSTSALAYQSDTAADEIDPATRAEIRRLIAEELKDLLRH